MSDTDQAAMEALAGETEAEVGTPFYEYGEGEGKLTFKTPDELKSHLDRSINFERDYTQKSQKRESEYRAKMEEMEKRQREFDERVSKWEKEEKAKYDKYNDMLSSRPSIARELERLANNPITPSEIFERGQGYTDQKTSELEARLKEFEDWRAQQELERQTESVYANLEKKYPDFDRELIKKALAELDGENTEQLIEMMHKAAHYNPAEMQERVEQNIAKKAGAGMIKGGGQPPPKQTGPLTNDEAYQKALEEYAGITGG